jgi:hypothetical protein
MASSSGSVAGGGSTGDQGSVPGLLSRLMDDAMALARNELALAKAEARGALRDLRAGIVPIAVAAAVLLAGALTLVAAIVLALAEAMEPWLAALIVSVALMVIGWLLLKVAQRKFENIGDRVERTQDSLQKDATVVARRT